MRTDGDARRHADQPQHRRGHERRRRRGDADARLPGHDTDRFGAFVQDSFEALDPRLTWIPGMRYDGIACEPRAGRGLRLRQSRTAGRRPLGPGALAEAGRCSSGSRRRSRWTGQTRHRLPGAAGRRPQHRPHEPAGRLHRDPESRTSSRRRPAARRAGRAVKTGAVEAMLTAYYTRYDDLIVSRAPLPCPSDPRCVPGATGTFQSQNVSEARIYGLEGKAAWRFATRLDRARRVLAAARRRPRQGRAAQHHRSARASSWGSATRAPPGERSCT